MGRKAKAAKPEKRTPVKFKPIVHKHAGKITEPWQIMERLIGEVDHFAPIKGANIKLWWAKDWKTDVDGIATGSQVCKASEIDRNLVEESGGETPDVFIKLAEKLWPTMSAEEKEHLLFHELCHVRPAKDSNGQQKRDAKERLLWRLARHPITAFHDEVTRYGIQSVIGRNTVLASAITAIERPLERAFVEADKERIEDVFNGQVSRMARKTEQVTTTPDVIGELQRAAASEAEKAAE